MIVAVDRVTGRVLGQVVLERAFPVASVQVVGKGGEYRDFPLHSVRLEKV